MRGLALRTLVEAVASPTHQTERTVPGPRPHLGPARQLDPCMTGVLCGLAGLQRSLLTARCLRIDKQFDCFQLNALLHTLQVLCRPGLPQRLVSPQSAFRPGPRPSCHPFDRFEPAADVRMLHQTPLLALLRRLEAQNIWRMSHNVLSAQPFSASAAVEAARGEEGWVRRRRSASGRMRRGRRSVLAATQAARRHCSNAPLCWGTFLGRGACVGLRRAHYKLPGPLPHCLG